MQHYRAVQPLTAILRLYLDTRQLIQVTTMLLKSSQQKQTT